MRTRVPAGAVVWLGLGPPVAAPRRQGKGGPEGRWSPQQPAPSPCAGQASLMYPRIAGSTSCFARQQAGRCFQPPWRRTAPAQKLLVGLPGTCCGAPPPPQLFTNVAPPQPLSNKPQHPSARRRVSTCRRCPPTPQVWRQEQRMARVVACGPEISHCVLSVEDQAAALPAAAPHQVRGKRTTGGAQGSCAGCLCATAARWRGPAKCAAPPAVSSVWLHVAAASGNKCRLLLGHCLACVR